MTLDVRSIGNYERTIASTARMTAASSPLCHCGSGGKSYTFDVFGRENSYGPPGLAPTTASVSLSYNDEIYDAPDGTSYIGLAIPQAVQESIVGYPAYPNAATTRIISYTYYPFADPRQDLIETTSQPSIDTSSKTYSISDTYSTAGLLTGETKSGYSAGASTSYSWAYVYDSKGRLSSATGPRTDVSQVTKFQYYPDTDTTLARRGQLMTVTDPLLHLRQFASDASPFNTYNVYGGPLSLSDENSVIADLSYDALGHRTNTVIKAAGSESDALTFTARFDAAARRTATVTPMGNSTTYSYNNDNDVTAVSRADSSGTTHEMQQMAYDPAGLPMTEEKLACAGGSCPTVNEQTGYVFNSGYADLTQATFAEPSGASANIAYSNINTYAGDRQGELMSEIYENAASQSVLEFDLTHDLYLDVASESIGASSSSSSAQAQFGYNAHQDLVNTSTAWNGSNSVTNSVYDDFDRLIKQASPETGTTTYTYDADANCLLQTNADGSTVKTTYDALDRPLVQTATSGSATETVSRAYDSTTEGAFGIGRLSNMTDPSGTTVYTYERRGLIANEVKTIGSKAYTTAYTYNDNGDLAKIAYPSARIATYAFDYADRPISVTVGSTAIATAASYMPFGPISSITLGNGVTQSFGYNARYQMNSLQTTAGAKQLQSLQFTQDAANHVVQITDLLNAGYDDTISISPSASSAPQLATFNSGSLLWGSGTSATDHGYELQGLTFSSYHGTSHSIALATGTIEGQPTNVTIDGSATKLTFNVEGDLTAAGSGTLSYSPRHLLATADASTYTYDGDRQRVSAKRGSSTLASLYDVANRHLLSESNLTNSGISYDYIWLGDRLIGELTSSTASWVATDYLTAPTILTNSSGTVVWQADYEPFGMVYALRTSDVHEAIRRPGQEAEEFDDGAGPNGDTPRYYNHSRWYRPQWGMYINADPAGRKGSLFSSYAYAANDPMDLNDPSGLCIVDAEYDRVWVSGIPLTGYHESITFASQGKPTYFAAANPEYPLSLRHFGSLLAEFGVWNSKEPLFNDVVTQADSKSRQLLNTGAGNCDGLCDKAFAFVQENNAAKTTYHPNPVVDSAARFENSNTFAYGLTEALGVSPPPPPANIWQPGYFPYPPGVLR